MSNCGSEGDQLGNRPACAACKHQRKRCPENCIMAPHFPPELKEEFMRVHRVFGLGNVTKMIKDLDFRQQKEAIKSFIFEANQWTKDPVHGPLREVEELKQQVSDLQKRTIQLPSADQDNRSNLLIEGSGDDQFLLEPSTADINPAEPVLFQERPLFVDGIEAVMTPSHHQSNPVLQGRNFHGLTPNPSFVQEQGRPSSGRYRDCVIQPANHRNSQLRQSFSRSVVLVQEQERLIMGERARVIPSSHHYQVPFVQERQSNGWSAMDLYQASTQRLQNNVNEGYGYGGGPAKRRLVHDDETASVHAGGFHGQAAVGMQGHQPRDTWNFAE